MWVHNFTGPSVQLHNLNPHWYWLLFGAIWWQFNIIEDNSRSWGWMGLQNKGIGGN